MRHGDPGADAVHVARGITVRRVGDISVVLGLGADGLVRLWDPMTAELHIVPGHARSMDVVATMAAAGGRSLLAVGGVDGVIRVYDLATGSRLFLLKGHVGPVHALAGFGAPDAPGIISRGWDGSARSWDLNTGQQRHAIPDEDSYHSNFAAALQSPDGAWVAATGGSDIQVWDPLTGVVHATLRVHGQKTAEFAVQGDGQVVLILGNEGEVQAVNLADGAKSQRFGVSDRTYAIASTTLSDGRDVAITANQSGIVRIWDCDSGTLLHSLPGPIGNPVCARLDDGTPVIALCEPETVGVWTLTDATCLWNADCPWFTALHVVNLSDGIVLAAERSGAMVAAWDLANGQPYPELLWPASKKIDQILRLTDGTSAVLTREDGRLRAWSIAGAAMIADIELGARHDRSATGAALPDGTLFAVVLHSGDPHVFNLATGELIAVLTGAGWVNSVSIVAFQDLGTAILTRTAERVQIWDPSTGVPVHGLDLPANTSAVAAFRRGLIVSGATDLTCLALDPH
jgi:WD40 repeat protein